ncbi:hypothetical protein [Hyphomicrobium sp.]|uniref:hypothetical protein n=1 Tax=Hyphomicrobium sp. TaxID=82 RepID=UPI0025C4E685|nr:hypothetical protein [Hyphomicrobium sp.]
MDPIEAVDTYGNPTLAANALGLPRSTFMHRYRKALLAQKKSARKADGGFEAPEEPPVDLPIEEILEQASKRFKLMKGIDDASNWPIIKIREQKPIGILWFGDPHLGDPGCDIDLIRKHAALCAATEGLYGANIGDTTNNWMTHGKLSKQWAEQDSSIATERRMARWLMTEAGVQWLVWIIGNHDAWNGGETILQGMNVRGIFMRNWEAKFILEFPDGTQIKIHAAHNFKGFSDWNPMHGPLKASIKASDADLYIAGHLHTPGSMQLDLPGSRRFPLLLRVASYKRFDKYAKLNGFPDHEVGSAVVTIFNPAAKDVAGKITHFFDVEMGARVLKAMRDGVDVDLASSREERPRKKSARAAAAGRGVDNVARADGRRSKVRR